MINLLAPAQGFINEKNSDTRHAFCRRDHHTGSDPKGEGDSA
jgi:hypothetical protein